MLLHFQRSIRHCADALLRGDTSAGSGDNTGTLTAAAFHQVWRKHLDRTRRILGKFLSLPEGLRGNSSSERYALVSNMTSFSPHPSVRLVLDGLLC